MINLPNGFATMDMATKQQCLNTAFTEALAIKDVEIASLTARLNTLEAARVAQIALNQDFMNKTTKIAPTAIKEPVAPIKRSFIQKILGK